MCGWGESNMLGIQKMELMVSLHHKLAVWPSSIINNIFGLLGCDCNRNYIADIFTSQGYRATQTYFVEYLLFTVHWASFWGRRGTKPRQCPGKRHWFETQTEKHLSDVEYKPLKGRTIMCLHYTAQCLECGKYLSSLYKLSQIIPT